MAMFDSTGIWVITIVSALAILAFGVVVRLLVRAGSGMSAKKKQAELDRLRATGAKARATVVTVQPTGMVVNNIYLRTALVFRLEPTSGAPAFDGSKTVLVDQSRMPRMGDEWPCWYDITDPSSFAVVPPHTGSAEEMAVYREFGIEHPLDGLR